MPAGVESPANKDQLGRNISTDGATKFYFPSQGEISHGGGYSNGIGTNWPSGKAWSSTVDAANFRSFGTTVSPTSVSYSGGFSQGYELPVRCVKL